MLRISSSQSTSPYSDDSSASASNSSDSSCEFDAASINLNLFDVDGCLYHACPDGPPHFNPIQQWFLSSNQAFFRRKVTEWRVKNYARIILAYGTNRQDFHVDRANYAEGGWPCGPVLPLLQSYFAAEFGDQIKCDPIWMADIYANAKNGGKRMIPGKSYRTMLKTLMGQSKQQHAIWMFDESKVSLLYAHAHRIASIHSQAIIDIDFYDDNEDKLKLVHDFFYAYPILLPTNVVLRLHKYDGELTPHYLSWIKGTGDIDLNYEWSLRYFSSQPYCYLNNVRQPPIAIQTAEELLLYFESEKYIERIGNCTLMMTPDLFDLPSFLRFRSEELRKLTPWNTCDAPNYLTAKMLLDAKLIPSFFILKNDSNRINNSLATFQDAENKNIDYDESDEGQLIESENERNDSFFQPTISSTKEDALASNVTKKYDANPYFNRKEKISSFMKHLPPSNALVCEAEINIVEIIRTIAKLSCWKDRGVSFFFWRKTPSGIQEIAKLHSNDLVEFAKIVNRRRNGVVTSKYDTFKVRDEMTSDFYDLLMTAIEPDMSRDTIYTAIHVFCEKWKITLASQLAADENSTLCLK